MSTPARLSLAALAALALAACGGDEFDLDAAHSGGAEYLVSVADPDPGTSGSNQVSTGISTASSATVTVATPAPSTPPAASTGPADSTPDPIPAQVRRCGMLADAMTRLRCLTGK